MHHLPPTGYSISPTVCEAPTLRTRYQLTWSMKILLQMPRINGIKQNSSINKFNDYVIPDGHRNNSLRPYHQSIRNRPQHGLMDYGVDKVKINAV